MFVCENPHTHTQILSFVLRSQDCRPPIGGPTVVPALGFRLGRGGAVTHLCWGGGLGVEVSMVQAGGAAEGSGWRAGRGIMRGGYVGLGAAVGGGKLHNACAEGGCTARVVVGRDDEGVGGLREAKMRGKGGGGGRGCSCSSPQHFDREGRRRNHMRPSSREKKTQN